MYELRQSRPNLPLQVPLQVRAEEYPACWMAYTETNAVVMASGVEDSGLEHRPQSTRAALRVRNSSAHRTTFEARGSER